MRKAALFLGIIFSGIAASPAAGQVEFTAKLQALSEEGETVAVLTMELTPSVSIEVRATGATELTGEDGLPISVLDLEPGAILRIEGIFTDSGVLALEVQVTDDESEFELRGLIESIDLIDENRGSILVVGFEILVPPSAEIGDTNGRTLSFGDLAVGQLVKVRGSATDEGLVAAQVRLLDEDGGFARVRLEGTISEIAGDTRFILLLDGGVTAVIAIDEETEIQGTLALGVRVRVIGTLTEELSVLAEKIVVLDSVRLAPDELEMGFNEIRKVNVILRNSLDEDVVFGLRTQNPEIAIPTSDSLTIPAGKLVGSFEIASAEQAGETVIEVSSDRFSASLKVEVEEDDDEEDPPTESDLKLRWEPRVIKAAPQGFRDVRLRINRDAPQDITVHISLKGGRGDLVEFPSQVVIPEGRRVADVRLEFTNNEGKAKLRATLPETTGGDETDLEIQIRGKPNEKLDIHWSPDDVELQVGGEGQTELRLDRPAPFDFEVVVSPKSGSPNLVEGIPEKVSFKAGDTKVTISFKALDRPGKVRFRAALPFDLGGDHDDLEIEVEKD